MLNIIIGKSGSGKTTLAKVLESKGLHRIITCTTREKRRNEQDGKDYHFMSEENFLDMDKNNLFAETSSFVNANDKKLYYGSSKNDYFWSKIIDSVVVLNPEGVKNVIPFLEENKIEYLIYFLNNNEKELKKRLLIRGDDELEIKRRLKADKEDFYEIEKLPNLIFVDDDYDILSLANLIKNFKKEEIDEGIRTSGFFRFVV